MPDLTIPQTKQAQKLKPYEGELPPYLATLGRLAKIPGISVRWMVDGYKNARGIYLMCSGTAETILKCPVIESRDIRCWPSGLRNSVKVSAIYESAASDWRQASIYKVADGCYVAQIREQLPDTWSVLDGGIEQYQFHVGDRWERIAFIGTRQALISKRGAPAELFPDDNTEEGRKCNGMERRANSGVYSAIAHETQRLDDGRWLYIKQPYVIEEERKRVKEQSEASYKSPDEWLEWKEDFIVNAARVLLSEFPTVDTISGMRFTLSLKHASEIVNAFEEIAQRIRGIPVRVTPIEAPPSDEAREKATSASVDGKFQKFMQQAIARPAAKKKGGDSPNAET